MAATVSREQVIAYRLDGQQLTERADVAALVAVAGRCYPQNTPPGSAGLALAARVRDVTAKTITAALDEEKTLLQAFGARGAPHVFPAKDAAVFTLGLLPGDDKALRDFLMGAQPALDGLGLAATEAVRLTTEAVTAVLDGNPLTKDDLGREAGDWITDRLPAAMREGWKSRSPYAAKQFLGESIVRFALPVVSMRALLCHGGHMGRSPLLRRTDQWVGTVTGRVGASADVVRRYLRCYGPSTPRHFAAWAGISAEQAGRMWDGVRAELAEPIFGPTRAWVLGEDLPRLESPPQVRGVRMLPPHDPYLQTRDRETIISDAALRKRVWRPTGNPGAVLVDGQLVATWRPDVKGRKLNISVEPLSDLRATIRDSIEEEAERIASHRGVALGAVTGL